MKKTLPVSPFLTSRVISDFANSTSARTNVDTCEVASLTSSPIEGLGGTTSGSTRGIEVTVVGTPFLRSRLLTAVLQRLVSSRFMLPCRPGALPWCYASCI